MAVSNGSGFQGGFENIMPAVGSILADPSYQPDVRECAHLGAAKAHRQIVFAHYDFRNHNRSPDAKRGRVG